MFTFAFFAFNSVLQAAWPVSAEIFHRGNFESLRKTIINCIIWGVVVILGFSMVLCIAVDPITHILSPKDSLTIPLSLIGFFAVYWLIRVWCDTFAMLVQSADGAHILCLIVPVQAILNLAISTWAAQRYGLYGLLIGMTLSFLLTVAWFNPLTLLRMVRRRQAEMAAGHTPS
jgi:O-antigen/teichoic acid export membrane protein